MGDKVGKCPGKDCGKILRYQDYEVCPECGFEVADWWDKRQQGLADRLNVDKNDIKG